MSLVALQLNNTVFVAVTGSLGARITELKQKVIAENPRRYSLAVPRKSLTGRVYMTFSCPFVLNHSHYIDGTY